MAFSVQYSKDFKYQNEIEEFIIQCGRPEQLTSLDAFLAQHQDKTIVADIGEMELEPLNIKLLNALAEKYPHFKVLMTPRYSKEDVEQYAFPYFFSTFVSTFEILQGALSMGVCDVYIANELGFALPDVAVYVHNINPDIKIRVVPNVAQSSWQGASTASKKFFIRPDDIQLYSTFVDVFEIMCPRTMSVSEYYRIYAIEQKWHGPLHEIILQLNDTAINNTTLTDLFAVRRLNCHKRCNSGSSCNMCEECAILSQTLLKNNLTLK